MQNGENIFWSLLPQKSSQSEFLSQIKWVFSSIDMLDDDQEIILHCITAILEDTHLICLRLPKRSVVEMHFCT